MGVLKKFVVAGLLVSAGPAFAWDFADIPEPPPLERDVEVQATYIELHTGPADVYPVTQVIERGQVLTVIKRRTGWVKVSGPRGQEGWIKEATLAEILAASRASGEESGS